MGKPIRFKYERADKSEKFDDGVVKDHPYGFVLSMWGEENVVTGLVTTMQSGETDCVLVYCRVDSPLKVVRMNSNDRPETRSSFREGLGEAERRFERFLTNVAREAARMIAGNYVTPESRTVVENAVLRHLLLAYS